LRRSGLVVTSQSHRKSPIRTADAKHRMDIRAFCPLEDPMSEIRTELPVITITESDFERLDRLTAAAAKVFPRTADFLAREIARANIVDSGARPTGAIGMGSTVTYRDDVTGNERTVTLVFPDEADLAAGKISVLTPVGAALIGLSAGQSIEWRTPGGGIRSLTVLRVGDGAQPPPAGSRRTVNGAAAAVAKSPMP
jgi:regulator of nucleoside diphosphate kinase